ncbi:FtsW/RodA/SpoVE family cell cycle protein [Corynebacterium freiburgense]|uniref:FtsW/RodA/SpoVE family cell cycle protein n=1 Tax=Corynebacterium freiburgense TaxID=556548 RepID=UPI0004178C3E|nr:FtsW/RodA/SpoVE family cell cycle protein [Corynebacterium freiburgense]WJZ01338.1 Lipid II flippase FtsW [Corynebacterium freiburgense]
MIVFERLGMRRLELGLLILASLIVGVAVINLEISVSGNLTSDIFMLMGGFITVFLIAHLVMCWKAPYADQIMLPVAAILNGLGLVVVYRIDIALPNVELAPRQVMWTFVGVALMVLVLIFLNDYRSLTKFSFLLGLVGLIFLALPMVWPVDTEADADIWITIGPLSLQPGEFSKIMLLLFFAQLLVNKRALFNVAGYRILGLDFPRVRDLAPILGVWAIALMIMAGENDFGPALLLFGTVLGMLYLASGRASWLIIGVILVSIGGFLVYQISGKIQARVSHFMDPLADPLGTGRQLSQSLFGMSWGGITGTGLGQGYPQMIPVVFSDYILAAVAEELGLFGIASVLILFAIFISRGMHTALTVPDSYGKLVASGLSLTLAIQIFVVTAGISALMPMTGLTTPFMSQGGSSLMANYILMAIILRISDSSRREAEANS